MSESQQNLKSNEKAYIDLIEKKVSALRLFLNSHTLNKDFSVDDKFHYLTKLKEIIGNFHNDISFLSTLMAKRFLEQKYGPLDFDAGEKPQGAPGPDIALTLSDGRSIHCEIKTTKPYQPGFGAQQKTAIKKDLTKLTNSPVDLKFMMVTDQSAFETLCGSSYASHARGIVIVNLLSGKTFIHS